MKYVILLGDKSLFVGIDGERQVVSTTDSQEATLIQSKPFLDSLISILNDAGLKPTAFVCWTAA